MELRTLGRPAFLIHKLQDMFDSFSEAFDAGHETAPKDTTEKLGEQIYKLARCVCPDAPVDRHKVLEIPYLSELVQRVTRKLLMPASLPALECGLRKPRLRCWNSQSRRLGP